MAAGAECHPMPSCRHAQSQEMSSQRSQHPVDNGQGTMTRDNGPLHVCWSGGDSPARSGCVPALCRCKFMCLAARGAQGGHVGLCPRSLSSSITQCLLLAVERTNHTWYSYGRRAQPQRAAAGRNFAMMSYSSEKEGPGRWEAAVGMSCNQHTPGHNRSPAGHQLSDLSSSEWRTPAQLAALAHAHRVPSWQAEGRGTSSWGQ